MPKPNIFAVSPLLFVPLDRTYDTSNKARMKASMERMQSWMMEQSGYSFRLLRTRVIRYPKTVAQLAAVPNIYHEFRGWLDSNPINDTSGERIGFCNYRRCYTLNVVGEPNNLGNMAGRSSWNCSAAVENPLEPWGPGTAAGFTGNSEAAPSGTNRGAVLHEVLHCFGVPHPDPGEPGATQSIMSANYVNFDAASFPAVLIASEILLVRASPFFTP
jgi:hypothetical protein